MDKIEFRAISFQPRKIATDYFGGNIMCLGTLALEKR